MGLPRDSEEMLTRTYDIEYVRELIVSYEPECVTLQSKRRNGIFERRSGCGCVGCG